MKFSLPKLSGKQLALSCLALIICKLSLVSPHELVATSMPHDDLLFISLAENILRGEWLGQYNQLTLIKGPFYPVFIALSYLLNIPLLKAQQLLNAFSCIVFIRAIYPVCRCRWSLLLIFIFLLYNPFSYNYPLTGAVFRESIYPSLALLIFASLMGLYVYSQVSLKHAVAWALLSGVALTCFWHTREESVWILPSLILLGMAMIGRSIRNGTLRSPILLTVFILPIAIWSGITFSLRMINTSYYGISATIELETAEFESAYGGLLRIKSEKWRKFHPVVKDAREKAYQVSPTFRKLEKYLEGDVGKEWGYMSGTGDISAAFFIWAFRDAVAYAGYYENGPQAMDFYRQMGKEIDSACEGQILDCRARITSLVPTWHQEFNQLLIPTFYSVFKRIIFFEDFSAKIKGILSKGPAEFMMRYHTISREQLRTSRQDMLEKYPKYHNHLNKEKIRILEDIGNFYQTVVPVLFAISSILLLVQCLTPRLRKYCSCYTFFALALFAGLCAITFILTLVVITSYISIHRAMHVSYPLVLLFIVTTVLASIDCIKTIRLERQS